VLKPLVLLFYLLKYFSIKFSQIASQGEDNSLQWVLNVQIDDQQIETLIIRFIVKSKTCANLRANTQELQIYYISMT